MGNGLAQKGISPSADVNMEKNLKALFEVAVERRAQFYKPDAQPVKLQSDPKFSKLESVMENDLKSSPLSGELGIDDELGHKVIQAVIGTNKNLKPEISIFERSTCNSNTMCGVIISEYAPKSSVEFANADQNGKEKLFNQLMGARFGAGKDYYGEVRELAIKFSVAYVLFTDPSDKNVAQLKNQHHSVLSSLAPYLGYLFTEKERRGRAQLAKLIEEYEKREGFA